MKQCKDCRYWNKSGKTETGGNMTCSTTNDIPNHIPYNQYAKYLHALVEKYKYDEACNLFKPEETK